jgi:hypothetical protein
MRPKARPTRPNPAMTTLIALKFFYPPGPSENMRGDSDKDGASDGGTERAGFEPAIPIAQYIGFRDRRLQPLGHLSAQSSILSGFSFLASPRMEKAPCPRPTDLRCHHGSGREPDSRRFLRKNDLRIAAHSSTLTPPEISGR